jgi:hypothetical protein
MYIWWSLVMALGITLFNPSGGQGAEAIKLPAPVKKGGMPLVEALEVRRTVRRRPSPWTQQISQPCGAPAA